MRYLWKIILAVNACIVMPSPAFAPDGRVCHQLKSGAIMCVTNCTECKGKGNDWKCLLKDKCYIAPDFSKCPKPDSKGVFRCDGKTFYLQ